MLEVFIKTLFTLLLALTMNCSANDDVQNNDQTTQALANLDSQLVNLEFQKAQVNQQHMACLYSTNNQAPTVMPCYGPACEILQQTDMLSAQAARMAVCNQTANYQRNQIEQVQNDLLYQRSMLEQQSRANSQPSTTTNNPATPIPALPPASNAAPASEADKMQSLYYRQRADEAHQRQLELIREQGNFNLRRDCNNSGGIWVGRPVGCN